MKIKPKAIVIILSLLCSVNILSADETVTLNLGDPGAGDQVNCSDPTIRGHTYKVCSPCTCVVKGKKYPNLSCLIDEANGKVDCKKGNRPCSVGKEKGYLTCITGLGTDTAEENLLY